MPTEWTVETLKELFDRRFEANEKSVDAAFKASEKAIDKSENAQTAYNARSNEFRAALDDQAKTLLPRTEADVRFAQMQIQMETQGRQIVTLQNADSRGEGASSAASAAKSSSQWLIGLTVVVILQALVGASGLIFYLVTHH